MGAPVKDHHGVASLVSFAAQDLKLPLVIEAAGNAVGGKTGALRSLGNRPAAKNRDISVTLEDMVLVGYGRQINALGPGLTRHQSRVEGHRQAILQKPGGRKGGHRTALILPTAFQKTPCTTIPLPEKILGWRQLEREGYGA